MLNERADTVIIDGPDSNKYINVQEEKICREGCSPLLQHQQQIPHSPPHRLPLQKPTQQPQATIISGRHHKNN